MNLPRSYQRWAGSFGGAYTERNYDETVADVDAEYSERFGVTQTELLKRYFAHVDHDARILEVGCNVGVQLEILQSLGFQNLYGLDIHRNALLMMKDIRPAIQPLHGSAHRLPFPADSFDVIFTVDVLMHMPPEILEEVIDEIIRCSRRFIIGSEYFEPTRTDLLYRGESGMLWKDDYASLYTKHPDIFPENQEILRYNGQLQSSVGDRLRSIFSLELTHWG